MNATDDEELWVCVVCGRTAQNRAEFTDLSCGLRSVKAKRSACEFADGRVAFIRPGGIVRPSR